MTNYLTDAERQTRLNVVHYQFWIRFELRGQAITRWFETAQDRDTYGNELVIRYQVVILDRGEQS